MQTTTQSYLSSEHQQIFEQTKDIPGWQLPGDSFKLYEMGYHCGDVILEIGTYGGRSAVVELQGALANAHRTSQPQFFGIDVDLHSIWRTAHTLAAAGLSDYTLLYHGDLKQFLETFSIQPTMVFVDGDHRYEGIARDLQLLTNLLSGGIPVLCHDYTNSENDTGEYGIRQAVTEWVEAGYAQLIGSFGCSAFLLTTDKCGGGSGVNLTPAEFAQHRAKMLMAYLQQGYEHIQGLEANQVAQGEMINQLQHHLQRQQQELATSELKASTLQQELATSESKVSSLQQEMGVMSDKLEQLEERWLKAKEKLQKARERILSMENSKLWQLRGVLFKVKSLFGNLGS